MSPFIKIGDDIFVKQVATDTLSIGDVLVVLRENDIVTHRLVWIGNDGYVCKGDNTHIPDAPVSDEQIFGKVIAIERAGRRISSDSENWKSRNHIMGRLGYFELKMYDFVSRVRKKPGYDYDRSNHISVGRIFFSPFRAIMRLISK